MTTPTPVPVIAIHGGAGTLSRASISSEQEQRYHAALRDILLPAQRLLADGGSALDAVTLAVAMLEDCPLFNAGHGSVFTHDETHELDASIMDGASLRAGAVACVSRIRYPVRAARAVMERSGHVLFVAAGAEAFAEAAGLEMVAPDYFSTEARREQLRCALAANATLLDHDGAAMTARATQTGVRPEAQSGAQTGMTPLDENRKFGTVGAVALDAQGNLAAATSTGGLTNKLAGRVGDTPLIGAGNYADNRTAAVSCTGTGEMFMRTVAAYDVCARMAYGGQSLEAAAHELVMTSLPMIGGSGGLIAVDAKGNICLPFNSEGMYRGFARVGEAPQTAIYR